MLHPLALGMLDGQIQTVRTVVSTDKLGRVSPVGGCPGDLPRVAADPKADWGTLNSNNHVLSGMV
ncbi:hypothetical protein [Kitasatospora sp. NPDC096204]|uniref:hypothetical protein n=1 Tax=Kitasatospora sp. NPDC096204 TaxID=3364094 RepID=UPI00380D3780